MFRWLRSGNPYLVIILLVYAIGIKYYYLIHPQPPLLDPLADGGIYRYLLRRLQTLPWGPGMFTILAFMLLYAEAIILNGIVNRFRLLPAAGYFPAFCYLLFTSFFPQWNVFSAPLIANLILLILLPGMMNLYAAPQPRSRAFSLGFLAGIAALIYSPVLLLLLLIWIALAVSRPFRPAEWILVLMGLLCPYYFLGTILFLLDKLSLNHIISFRMLGYPHLLAAPWVFGGVIFILIWFLYGNIRMQADLMKMMIHVRKCWQILLAFAILAVFLPFLPDTFSFTGWLIAFLPMSVFIALAFWHIHSRWLALLIHLCAVVYVLLIQWVY